MSYSLVLVFKEIKDTYLFGLQMLILRSVWRPLRHSVEDWPLTLCDGRTITYDDLLATDVVREDFQEYVGSNMFALYTERSRWHYISKQKPDEVWMFKQYDSDAGIAARCPYISFPFLIIWLVLTNFASQSVPTHRLSTEFNQTTYFLGKAWK